MVSDVIKYGGIYAKTCALWGMMLKYEDILELASSEDVKEFAAKLGEKEAYHESVNEALSFGASRIAIERSLSKSLYRDYAALYSFITDGNERKYLDAVNFKYAAGIIRRIIRRLFDHRDIIHAIPQYESSIKRHLGINTDKIEQSRSIEEMIENLRGTDFYDILKSADGQGASLFDYEMRMDFHCFIKTYDAQEKYLDKSFKKSARRINGADVDLQKLMWIYRAKKYYEISNEKIFTYLIPIRHMLSNQTVKELVRSDGSEEFLSIVSKTRYKEVFENIEDNGLERNVRGYMNGLYEEERKKNPYSLASVVAHLNFKGQEIRNLTTLIECVRYKLPPEAALKRLSLDHLPGGSGVASAF